jgi:integrase
MRNKAAGGIGVQTSNFYLQAAKQFCRWMVRPARRATESPLAHLSGLNVRSDRRHDRRAFTVDELLCLLGYLSTAPVRAKMTGAQRALLYRLAVETGLRRGGLAKLTKASFHLDGGEPAVVVKAGAKNKYKAERRVPLRATTAELLRAHLADLPPDGPAFAVPPRQHSAKMVHADLDGARAAWLANAPSPAVRAEREREDFLRYRDSAGRYLDFHALRHTRGVWLFEHHKAHPREVQELMGVASIALVDRYTRSFRLTDLSVIERGPDLAVPPADNGVEAARKRERSASKTLPPSLPPEEGFGRTFSDSVGPGGPLDERDPPTDIGREITGKQADLTVPAGSDRVPATAWRGGRAAECAGFENRLTERLREFESPPLRCIPN